MRDRAPTLSGDRALALAATGHVLRLRGGGFGRDGGAESDDTDDDIGLTINARELRQHKLEFGKYRRAGEHEGGPLDHMFVGMQDEKVHRRERGRKGRSERRNPTWARGKRRGFSPRAAACNSQSAGPESRNKALRRRAPTGSDQSHEDCANRGVSFHASWE